MFMKLILKKFPKKYDWSSIFLYYTYMQLVTTYPNIKSCTSIMFEYFDTTIFWTLMFILHSFLTFLKIIILENWNYIISFSQLQTKYFITFYGRVVLLKLHKFNCQPIFCLSFKTTQVSPNMIKKCNIRLNPFSTSAKQGLRVAILLPLKNSFSNCSITTLFYCLTL